MLVTEYNVHQTSSCNITIVVNNTCVSVWGLSTCRIILILCHVWLHGLSPSLVCITLAMRLAHHPYHTVMYPNSTVDRSLFGWRQFFVIARLVLLEVLVSSRSWLCVIMWKWRKLSKEALLHSHVWIYTLNKLLFVIQTCLWLLHVRSKFAKCNNVAFSLS